MDSRERVLAAIGHERPDRIPADIWAEPEVWERLRRELGLATDDDVRDRLSVDVRYLAPVYPADTFRDGVRQNMWGERWRKVSTVFGMQWEHVDGVLSGGATLEDAERFPWPTCDQVDYSRLAAEARRYEGKAIFYGDADFFERPGLVRGIENMMADVLLNQDLVDYLQERFLSFFIEDFHRAMEATGGRIDVFRALTDLGTQDRLIMGPETMERFVFRPLARLAEAVHRAGARFMFHSCGAVRQAVPRLIECGVDILNPIQPAARGMEPAGLKRDFGKDIAFHGGIDIQFLLPLQSADVVAAETARIARTLGEDGGYVLAPSHNIQPDSPTENILAMYGLEARRR